MMLTRTVRIAFLVLVLTLSGSFATLACHPAPATVCQRFERADAVFVGTLTKAERKDEGSYITLYATFTVLETYKGNVGASETIKFGTGDCDPTFDKIGERYFVFKEPMRRPSLVANYTHVLGNPDIDLAFAKQVNPKKPVFRISGFLSGLPKADFPRTRIMINDGRKNKSISIDRNGWFGLVRKDKHFQTIFKVILRNTFYGYTFSNANRKILCLGISKQHGRSCQTQKLFFHNEMNG